MAEAQIHTYNLVKVVVLDKSFFGTICVATRAIVLSINCLLNTRSAEVMPTRGHGTF